MSFTSCKDYFRKEKRFFKDIKHLIISIKNTSRKTFYTQFKDALLRFIDNPEWAEKVTRELCNDIYKIKNFTSDFIYEYVLWYFGVDDKSSYKHLCMRTILTDVINVECKHFDITVYNNERHGSSNSFLPYKVYLNSEKPEDHECDNPSNNFCSYIT